jgi:RNA polymerase sigma-70 factor (ECF subfamily)
VESTASLLARMRQGDPQARELLLRRYLPILRRWAHGRLPRFARDLLDTDDLVQVTLVRALGGLGDFEPVREGALLAYLRTAVLNAIRSEIRRVRRRPQRAELSEDLPNGQASPLEEVLGREVVERYERALARLRPEEAEAIMLRIELEFTYARIAEALGKPSPDAARMFVTRALAQLGRILDETP